MASAITIGLTSASHPDHSTSQPSDASAWASLLREAFGSLQGNGFDGSTPAVRNETLNPPRRRHADQRSSQLAAEIASLLYPAPLVAGLSQLIKYGQLPTASYPLSFCVVYAHVEVVPAQHPSSQARCGFFT